MPSSISNYTLEYLLHGGEPMKYGSMEYVYGWMMRSTNQLALIINRSEIMITLKIRLNTIWILIKIVEANQDFGITLSFKLSLLKITMFMVLLIETRGRVLLQREGDVGSLAPNI